MSVVDDVLGPCPVVVAPMGGGPTTVDLVVAAADAGALAFVAGPYKSATELETEIRAVAAQTARYGVNVFVPGRPAADADAVEAYVRAVQPDAANLGVELGVPRWDDDDWAAKVELLVDLAPPVCSFTFGCPDRSVVDALHRRGVVVVVTVTSPAEAALADALGTDLLCAQGIEAGAHRGTFDDTAADLELPTIDLVRALTAASQTPIIAAGGIATPSDVDTILAAGAVATQCGTAFLLCDEAGTNGVHRAALVDPAFEQTALTRAFTGRRARGLVNGFMRAHPDAPSAFPEIHHAVRPLRAAAVREREPDLTNLWAGTRHRDARGGPVAEVLDWLAGGDQSSVMR